MTAIAATAPHIFVIACAAEKQDHAAPAAELYASDNFKLMLAGAQAEAESNERELGVPSRVMILSAEHGLVELDEVLDPYNTKMGDRGCIRPEVVAQQLGALRPEALVVMLPKAYRETLEDAASIANMLGADVDLYDVYEVAPGIGYQRGVAASLIRNAA